MKNDRHRALLMLQEMLQTHALSTQKDIQKAFKARGMTLNQTFISRLMNQLGVIKVMDQARAVYRLPETPQLLFSPEALRAVIIRIACNESLIVIKTSSGSAQMLAYILDRKHDWGILGTVAGDDTVFIAPEKIINTKKLFTKIYRFFYGSARI